MPTEYRTSIISAAHEPPTTGYIGIYEIFHRILEQCYWPTIRVARSLKLYVNGSSQQQPTGKRDERPLEMILPDLIGQLTTSILSNCYLLIVTDYLIKFFLMFFLEKQLLKQCLDVAKIALGG